MDFTDCNIAFREHFISSQYILPGSRGCRLGEFKAEPGPGGLCSVPVCDPAPLCRSSEDQAAGPVSPVGRIGSRAFPMLRLCCESKREETACWSLPGSGTWSRPEVCPPWGGHSLSPHLGRVRAQHTTTGHPQGKPRKTPRED